MNDEEKYKKLDSRYTTFGVGYLIISMFVVGFIQVTYSHTSLSIIVTTILILSLCLFMCRLNENLNEIINNSEFYDLGCQYVTKNFNYPNIKTWKELEKKYENFTNEYSGFQIRCFKIGHDETLEKMKKEKKNEINEEKNSCLKNEMMKLIVNADLEDMVRVDENNT